jgi:putative ABC transport system permease protein
VALAQALPPRNMFMPVRRLEIEGEEPSTISTTRIIRYNEIGSGYFSATGTRLTAGTLFTDTTANANQIIINEQFALKQWPSQSPLGKHLRMWGAFSGPSGKTAAPPSSTGSSDQTPAPPWFTIVGVATDGTIPGPGPKSIAAAAPYFYMAIADTNANVVVARTSGSANTLSMMQTLVHSIDPGAKASIESVEEGIQNSTAPARYVMALLTAFSGIALILAAVGLYGVMAYSVAEQTKEIGIRLALGATSWRIGRSIMFRSLGLATTGAAIGMVGAIWGTKVIENQLYGVTRSDVASFVTTVVVLLAVAIVACIVPTRRALAVDPMTAIRAE